MSYAQHFIFNNITAVQSKKKKAKKCIWGEEYHFSGLPNSSSKLDPDNSLFLFFSLLAIFKKKHNFEISCGRLPRMSAHAIEK